MKKKFLASLLLSMGLLAAVIWGGGARSIHDVENVTFPIVTTGDTAAVLKFTPSTAMDSFTYKDTMVLNGDADSVVVSYVSPSQIMILTPTVDTTATYTCSIVFPGGTLGFNYVCPEDTSTATFVTAFVDSIEGVADLTDSVKAEDSVTYVKILSLFTQEEYTARWSMKVTGATLDTASDIETVAEICDGMVAATNGSACSTYITAYDSTTFWIVQSDDPGLEVKAFLADTATDTTRSQANVVSRSILSDTINLRPILLGDRNYAGIIGKFTFDSSTTTANQGIGLDDSLYMYLYASHSEGGSIVYWLIDSDSANALPGSLRVSHPVAAGSDSLLKENLHLVYLITDSASDTTVNMLHRISMDYILYEQ